MGAPQGLVRRRRRTVEALKRVGFALDEGELPGFVARLACVVYFPVAWVLGHAQRTGAPGWLAPIAPASGFLFPALSFGAWRFGVRRYTSTGG